MAEKFTRNQRIGAITKVLVENPNRVINLNTFTSSLNAAKSTISEDIVIVRECLSKLFMGKIETISGASGGIKYIPDTSNIEKENFMSEICSLLSDHERIIPGNFLYMTDLLYDPRIISKAGAILASKFNELDVDCVITVETKGIPLAYEVAKCLGVKLVIVRHDTKITEGTTVSINYVSGSSKRIQTMTLARKAIDRHSKCIFIDDFMKGGGTATGIINLLKEFECELLGIGVFIEDIETKEKLVKDYISLLQFEGINEEGNAVIYPSNKN
ncbi:pur operon repressor [Hathewaya limosa]|uniref:Purine operon repressor n=1 Tax=Hathewaya limosa TaxID=1536 RepID=A0ABU0JNE0_HATLI|nr:pur operon repressor [Hathewaya limosa]MDQ0478595.1 purine operon repressor [Hathewaya limosa]